MEASYAQISITKGRKKVLKALKKNGTVKVMAEITLTNDCPDNLYHDEDCVFDFITGDVKVVSHEIS